MDVIKNTIVKNYPDLIESYTQISQINWDRMFKEKNAVNIKKTKKQKTSSNQSSTKKISLQEKEFLSFQKAFVLLGTHINGTGLIKDHIMKINIDPQNYDELMTNIKWIDHKLGIKVLLNLNKLCEKVFDGLYIQSDKGGDWTIRTNTSRLFYEMMSNKSDKPKKKLLKTIAKEIEESIMLYTVLMVSETCNGSLSSISWDEGLVKSVYLSKSNSILASLTNKRYSSVVFEMLQNGELIPIEISFMKRSQLLGNRFEDLEINRLKIYEESGLLTEEEDYTLFHSSVTCKKCKLNHTSFVQLQIKSSDEAMTIFYYCHKCKFRSRE